MSIDGQIKRPWYKEPMVWLMLGLPLTSIIMVSIFVTIAVKYGDTVVRDNYYKDGLAINQELALDDNAKSLAIAMMMNIDKEQGLVQGKLLSKSESPEFLKLNLIHPTLKEQDQEVLLQKMDDKGNYQGQVQPYLKGRFHLHLSSPVQKWRVRQLVELSEKAEFVLNGQS